MKEWFLSADLVGLDGMPNSVTGVSQKARRNKWLSRPSNTSSKVFEFHISNFHPDLVLELREKFGDDSIPENVTEISNVKSVRTVSAMDDMCAVPVYNVYASCGFGAQNGAEYQLRTEFLPCLWLKRFGLTEESARIIICHGDSMEDTLSDGDEVLVDIRELDHPVKHGVYVVRIGKHVYIKRLKYDIMAEGYEVISDNKAEYDPFIVNEEKLEDFAVIGKVVTTVMKAVI
ncbi:transcriptional regulator [Vibrio genomosp. F10 str. ZF-129]|uniref:Transcriptional regulator n=1 Tax=Vibrio genomosp. F10 str. ZF-129 TaxID=1187848 RepID=A0A1E5BB10_9VIBR|nr:S24 family peptidase [Vibrio genomosp. F10]OEE30756.1 transcriptional regulator [Vibrio genomosp. F10 str. ZF-129]